VIDALGVDVATLRENERTVAGIAPSRLAIGLPSALAPVRRRDRAAELIPG